MQPQSADLTFFRTVTRYFLRHQHSLFVFAVNLHYLLPTLSGLGSRQSRNGFFPADLTLQWLLPWLKIRRQQTDRLLRLLELRILTRPLDSHRNGGHLGVGFMDIGVVVIVAHCSGLDGRELEDLVSRFFQNALRLGLIQLASCISNWHSLALGSCTQVAVAVNGVKVFGDWVLIIVAVQAKFLFRAVGTVAVLWGKRHK